ncbi:hypothetical protein BU198_38550 [Streptomyces sp. CBMA156]|nr:hypothetical protein [Streptomyces sp. CBMA156]
MAESTARDPRVHGVGTRHPDRSAAFAEYARIPFPPLSGTGLPPVTVLLLRPPAEHRTSAGTSGSPSSWTSHEPFVESSTRRSARRDR